MCGRSCLTLQPDELLCACKYKTFKETEASNNANNNDHSKSHTAPNKFKKEPLTQELIVDIKKETEDHKQINIKKEDENDDKDNKSNVMFIKPEWRAEFNCGRTFIPSYNIAPTDITPVLVSSAHFSESTENGKDQTRDLVPMMWGMIPFWHKGDYRRHGLTTHNCRLEHMLNSKLYAGPFRRGQRCVVLCEGFYEWQTTKIAKPSERAVYFIYMPQKDDIKIYEHTKSENINLLKMAGIFDVWTDENGDKIYSYSVITYESSRLISWMHHRMPAILETEEQVNDWLDFKRVPGKKALDLLKPARHLQWHRVSNIVNNSRNKSPDCTKPYDMTQAKKINDNTNTSKNKSLLSWLNVRKRREDSLGTLSDKYSDCVNSEDSDLESPAKRPKFHDYKKT